MSIFTMADTHLSFTTNKPMNIFGTRWQNHSEKIETNWNSIVSPDDTVIIPGDISWAMHISQALPDLQFINSLNGHKIISKGNHDYWWETMNKNTIFKEQNHLDSIDFLFNNAFNVEDITVCGTRGWYNDKKDNPDNADYALIIAREAQRLELSIKAALEISQGRELVAFVHFPPVFGDYVYREIVDIMHSHDIRRCYFGHIHGVYDIPQTINFEGIDFTLCSADFLDFTPLKIQG